MPVLTKINTNVIADDAVTAAKIPADALGATDIAANAIGISELDNTATGIQSDHYKIPSITTTQRDALTAAVGMLIYNSTLGMLQQYGTNEWQSIASPPVYSSTNVTNLEESDSTQTLIITGSNFDAGVVGKLVDNNGATKTPTTSTRNSSTQVTIVYSGGDVLADTVPQPLDVVITNGSGLSITAEDVLTIDAKPVWTTAAGALSDQTYYEDIAISTFNFVATDAENTPTYTISSGALPTGLSLSSAGALTGTPNVGALDVTATQTHNFDVRADDTTGNTTDRSFSIVRNSGLAKDLAYEFRANAYTGSTGNTTDGTNLSSCITFGSSHTTAECEFGTIFYDNGDSYAPDGECFTFNNNGCIGIYQSSEANYNTYYNHPNSCTMVMWVHWTGSSRQGFFSRYGSSAPVDGVISHFNHMFDSHTQLHHNSAGVVLGSGDKTGSNWESGDSSKWVLWHITYDVSDGYWRRYVDGSQWHSESVGTNSGRGFAGPASTPEYDDNETPHMVAGRTDNTQRMQGSVAEVRWYTRAMSASEISAEWADRKGDYSRS